MSDDSSQQGNGSSEPEPELSEEEMALLDQAIDRLPDDDAPPGSPEPVVAGTDDEVAPTPVLGDVILSVAERKEHVKEADLDTPDPAAEEEVEAEERWDPVDDVGLSDMELRATDHPKTQDELWDEIEDAAESDLVLVDVEERSGDPWGPVQAGDLDDSPVHRPSSMPRPGPVARLASAGPRRRPAPTRSLPWRGTTRLREPDLGDLLFIADATSERSRLLVATWGWNEDAPGGTGLRLRLTDDGPELLLPAAAPHEAALEVRLLLDDQSVRTRLALAADREQRGVRLGRDVLAGRFQVDPGADAWPDGQDE